MAFTGLVTALRLVGGHPCSWAIHQEVFRVTAHKVYNLPSNGLEKSVCVCVHECARKGVWGETDR